MSEEDGDPLASAFYLQAAAADGDGDGDGDDKDHSPSAKPAAATAAAAADSAHLSSSSSSSSSSAGRARSLSPNPAAAASSTSSSSGKPFSPSFHASPGKKLQPVFSSLVPSFDNFTLDSESGGDLMAGLVLDESAMLSASSKFLDTYTHQELTDVFRDIGIVKELSDMGFADPIMQMDTSDAFVHRITVTDSSLLTSETALPPGPDGNRRFITNQDNFLVDLFARRKRIYRYDLDGYKNLRTQVESLARKEEEEKNKEAAAATATGNKPAASLGFSPAAYLLDDGESPMPTTAPPAPPPAALRELQQRALRQEQERAAAASLTSTTTGSSSSSSLLLRPMHAPSSGSASALQQPFTLPTLDLARRVHAFMRSHFPPPELPSMSPLLRADFDVVPLDTPDTACFAAVVMRAPEAASDKLADVLKVLTASSSSTSSSSSPNMPASWKTPSRAPPLAGTIMEWICMQHPPLPAPAPEINEGDVDSSGGGGRNRSYSTGGGGSVFPTSRPPYPGQRHPGLHILKPISHLFVRMAATHGRDGLVSTPEHLHNAVLYMAGGWVPFNPAFLGYLRALCLHDLRADLVKHGIAAVSWAMRNGHVVGVQTRVVETWSPQEIVYPTSGRVLAYVRGEGFMRVAAEVERTMKGRVKIEWESAKEIWGYSLDPETRARASGA